ncbi:MAG: hypothetical protein J2P15_06355 [Micromonosporaceae bacterium]|nr:hypothetical protein [Micromonosporaceae bacterium]
MQIIEVSVIGVRSSVLTLTRRESPLRFTFYPMIHIAEPAFYAAVRRQLRRCDLIVAEGVGGTRTGDHKVASQRPSSGRVVGSALTSSYELPARFQRSGLVQQDIDYEALGVPVRCPDMTDEEFTGGWNEVPLWQRAVLVAAAPLVGLHRLAFGSRRALAREMNLDDADWEGTFEGAESFEELSSLLGEQRDRLLLAELDRIHRERHAEPVTVAVVYGAAHVAPAVHGMRALHGYRVRDAEWLTVFGFEE